MDTSVLVSDENVDTSNIVRADDVEIDMSSATKVPSRTPAATRSSKRISTITNSTASKASSTVSNAAAMKTPMASPLPSSSALKHKRLSSNGLLDLPVPTIIKMLVTQAHAATAPGTDAWPHHEKFIASLFDVLSSPAIADQVVTPLASHVSIFVSAIATTLGCNRSGTQRKAMDCFTLLFEKSQLREALERSFDVCFAALVKLVDHNSSVFLAEGSRSALLAAMRHINASKVLHALCKEFLTKNHDQNKTKQAAFALLMADAMDMLTVGQFSATSSKDYSCTVLTTLPALNQAYYKDVVRVVAKMKKNAAPALKASCDTLVCGLANKGAANNVLTAETRELAKTDRDSVDRFEAAYKILLGKEMPTLTTASSSTIGQSPAASPASGVNKSKHNANISATMVTSPLPSSARKGKTGKTPAYAETMPRDIGSPVLQEATAVSHVVSDAQKEQSYPLPSSVVDHQVDYATAGPGLLAELEEEAHKLSGANPTVYNYEADLSMQQSSAVTADNVVKKIDFNADEEAGANAAPDNEMETTQVPLETAEDVTAACRTRANSADDDDDDNDVVFKQADFANQEDALNSTQVPLESNTPAPAANVVYSYGRSSMLDVPTPAAAAAESSSGLLSPASLALPSAVPTTTAAGAVVTEKRRSSGTKRKSAEMEPMLSVAVEEEDSRVIQEAVTAAQTASPRSQVNALRNLNHALKKQKGTNGESNATAAAAPAPAAALSAAVELMGALQNGAIAKQNAALQQSKAYWTEKREMIRAKRRAAAPTAAVNVEMTDAAAAAPADVQQME